MNSSKSHPHQWSRKPSVSSILAIVGTFSATLLVYIFGMGVALGWPISVPNLDFAARMGCFWGCVGSVLVSAISLNCNEAVRAKVALTGALVWAMVSGYYFFSWVAGTASC